MSDDSQAPSELQIQQAVRAAVAATDRGDYAGALKVFKAVYDTPGITAPPDGLSAYGLCVAIEEKQTKKGIDLCRAAISGQFYDSRHWINLVNLHLRKGDKPGALDVLREALAKMPNDASLLAMKPKVGLREAPPIGFLGHDNLLNRMLSRRRRGGTQAGASGGGKLHPVVMGLIVLVFFAAVFGGTFYVLYRQAYG